MAHLDTAILQPFCAIPKRLAITGMLRTILTAHFQVSNLEDTASTAIQNMVWLPDATTGIVIESLSRWTPELTEKRPGIIIKAGEWRKLRLGWDDRLVPDSGDGNTYHVNCWQGSHTLFCITGEGAETEKLAVEVFRELNEFGPKIRQSVDFVRFEVVQIGEELLLKGQAKENIVIPITVAYVVQEKWAIVPVG